MEKIQSIFHEIRSSLSEANISPPVETRFPYKLMDLTPGFRDNNIKMFGLRLHRLSKVELESSFIPLKLKSGFSTSLFIRASLNGLIVIDTHNNLVAKALKWEFEPNFLRNQINASTICPNIVEGTIRTQRFDDFDILFSSYFPVSWNYPSSAWSDVFPRLILEVLKNQVVVDVKNQEEIISEPRMKGQYSTSEKVFHEYDIQYCDLQKNIDRLIQSRDFFGIQPNLARVVFSHGDLMPSNLLERRNQSPILIDWVNGGFHNLFYDLTIQEVYNPSSEAWVNFFQLELCDIISKRLYSNGLTAYKKIYQEKCRQSMTINDLNHGVLSSLKEFASKNYLRHRNSENLDEGVKVIRGISEIVERVETSRVSVV